MFACPSVVYGTFGIGDLSSPFQLALRVGDKQISVKTRARTKTQQHTQPQSEVYYWVRELPQLEVL